MFLSNLPLSHPAEPRQAKIAKDIPSLAKDAARKFAISVEMMKDDDDDDAWCLSHSTKRLKVGRNLQIQSFW